MHRASSSVAAASAGPLAPIARTPACSRAHRRLLSTNAEQRHVERRATQATSAPVSGVDPEGQDWQARSLASQVTDEPSTSGSTAELSQQPSHACLANPATLRKIVAASTADEALEQFLEAVNDGAAKLSETDCQYIIAAALERGNVDLAVSIYRTMALSQSNAAAVAETWCWPTCSLSSVHMLVLGLAKCLAVSKALTVVEALQQRGLPRGHEVPFGYVVRSPMPPNAPFAVVQPQEGSKLVADAATRYQFELFSGCVASYKSDALPNEQNFLTTILRSLKLMRQPPCAAVHEMVVRAPDGTARTFRFGTESADVPAQEGERVTIVCAPSRGAATNRFLSSSPPNTRPGEALQVTNHKTRVELRALRPPRSNAQQGVPAWLLPTAVVLAGSDAATALIDPNLPLLIAAGLAATSGSAVLGATVIVPELKRLPTASKEILVQTARQTLLSQHNELVARMTKLAQEASEDVRMLARLWQLQNKMASVGVPGSYDTRMSRVVNARTNLEQRLLKRIDLIDGYARVINMIEIEVEMDTQVPQAEMVDIEQQILKLADLDQLQEDWRIQAEAQDEVERLLRQ